MRIYRVIDGDTIREELDPTAVARITADRQHAWWVDITRPTTDDIRRLAAQFSIHPVTVETLIDPQQHARVHVYPNYYLLVVYALEGEKDARDAPSPARWTFAPVEVDILLGPNYVITLHPRPVSLVERTIQHWRDRVNQDTSASRLVYTLLDVLVADYEHVLGAAEAEYRHLKHQIYAATESVSPAQFADLQDHLSRLEAVLEPVREDLEAALADSEGIYAQDAHAEAYFRDLHNRAARIIEEIERYDGRIDNAFQGYAAVMSNQLAQSSNRMNGAMARLTVVMLAMAVPAIITGLFGMNFEEIPAKKLAIGFWAASLLTLGATGLVLWYLRKKGWLGLDAGDKGGESR
ncbi:MAG: magnesium transporter CorA family protein [Armatimonadetes bacterium]|nr:magnesium transporter CorA family protein [Armatimonadota bacterium]